MMKPGLLQWPEGVTMKKMRSKHSWGKMTSWCSSVAALKLGDGESIVVGVCALGVPVFVGRGTLRAENKADVDAPGEIPRERRRLSSLSE